MDYMLASSVAILQIIWIDLLLSGDNAVVIALACRSLPQHLRKWGIILGAGVAIHELTVEELAKIFGEASIAVKADPKRRISLTLRSATAADLVREISKSPK